MKFSDAFLALFILTIILLIITPLSTVIMDFLIVVNIALSLIILLVAIYTQEALDFAAFPALLLVVTLFRLSLNISSTRLILSNEGDAGQVINTFGGFVIGDQLIVGVIIFLIIIVIQFIVITKGAERVAEVAARFTLDAMPGKQMAIDADLNTGLIDEQGAKERRLKIQREADFYGAMDGASKFVKGDAIVGIIITIINIVGGLIIGSMYTDMPTDQVLDVFTRATVGDGLVSQIPALMVSTATGIIVTRSASEGNLSKELAAQLTGQPQVLLMLGVMLSVVGVIPGMPKIPFYLVAVAFILIGYSGMRARKKALAPPPPDESAVAAEEKRKPENIVSLLQVDPIELEFGYGIIPLVDTTQGGDLLDRVVMIRRQCALDLGIIVPSIRLRDNIQLNTNEYMVKIKGVEVARGEIMADHFLALNAGNTDETISGIETVEPAFGLPALWINRAERERAELLGYTTIDPPSVIATHLTEIVKSHSEELLNRQQVQTLVDNLKRQQPALVEEVVPKMFTLGDIQKVLGNLLRESVPIRDMATIIETLGDYGGLTRDTGLLTEYVRQNLKRAITRRFVPDKVMHVITLDPDLEKLMMERTKQGEQGSYVALEPEYMQKIFNSLRSNIERLTGIGITPLVITSPAVRRHFKKIAEPLVPDLIVLSYNELEQNIEIHSDGIIRIA